MISLHHSIQVNLHPRAPFHFDATLYKPDHFPTPDNQWQPGTRWQTMRWEGVLLGLKFENQGEAPAPEIKLSIFSENPLNDAFLERLNAEIRYRYSFDLDLSAFYERFLNDGQLGKIIKNFYGMRDLNCSSLYEYLIIAILLQNAIVRRSVSMMQNMLENYGECVGFDGKQLYCFWEPARLAETTDASLRQLKVGYRARSILRVSEAFTQGKVNELDLRHKPYAEQRQVLLGLYGVGPASVGYILSGVFHHLDELQHISPWEQKIYSKIFFDRDPEEPLPVDELLVHLTERFDGFRAIAIHYFWEDLFWKWKAGQAEWLSPLIRL